MWPPKCHVVVGVMLIHDVPKQAPLDTIRMTEGGWLALGDGSHGLTHLGLFLQAQTVAPVGGQGLLSHTPVP